MDICIKLSKSISRNDRRSINEVKHFSTQLNVMFTLPHKVGGTKKVLNDIPEEATEHLNGDVAMLSYKQTKLCRAKATMKICYEKQENEKRFKEDSMVLLGGGGGGGGGSELED